MMHALREIIGNHAGRNPASMAIITLLWPYLNRLAKRFEALVRRVEAGALAKPRPASLAPRVRVPRFGPHCLPKPGMPRTFAWLIRLVPYHAACIGGQVRYLLLKPEMAALFIAAPQVALIFRPLCRMLGIAPERDLPPGLFRKRVRARAAALPVPGLPSAPDACGSALTPALSPKREREKDLPVANSTTPRLRARRRLPVVRAALA
jgi:hypothetical protein